MVVKAEPGSDAIAFAHNYKSGSVHWGRVFVRPMPPDGYVAMRTFMSYLGMPDSTACIREDLTVMGDTGAVYGQYGFLAWTIDLPTEADPHFLAYLAPGSFIYDESAVPPRTDPLMRVLKVDLPMLAEAPVQDFVPTLKSYNSPPDETMPRLGKAMLVPCTVVNDLVYSGNIDWQIANSPFYVLERQVYYKLLYHY